MKRRTFLEFLLSTPLLYRSSLSFGSHQSSTAAVKLKGESQVIHIGTHYDYPYAGGYLGIPGWRPNPPTIGKEI